MAQTPLSEDSDFMRVATAIALMILAMLADSSAQTTVARSEILLPIETTAH